MEEPVQQDVLLVGGGHTHALFLRMWGMNPLPGVRITLISRSPYAPYSGMLPGLIAGHFTWDETHIDLLRLCQFAGARFIVADVIGVDPSRKRVLLRDRPPLDGDIVSINTGISPDLGVPGSAALVTAVKPIHDFHQQWRQLCDELASETPLREQNVVVVGGGVAGVELVQAIQFALRHHKVRCHLIHRGSAVPENCPSGVQKRIAKQLSDKGIALHLNFAVSRVTQSGLENSEGEDISLDKVFWCTNAVAPTWPAEAGLACSPDGCIRVDANLQSVSHPGIFACGDIAHLDDSPRPKAGVYAVRQAPFLYRNVVNSLHGRALEPYQPQRNFLALITCGHQYAIASKWGLSVSGAWVWRWKQRIDRRFMRRLQKFPQYSTGPESGI